MITVIRFEYLDGKGIFYRNEKDGRRLMDIGLQSIGDRHNNNFNCPYADNLDLYLERKEWFCAYKSIPQVKNWITSEEILKLTLHGCKIFMLDVINYQVGDDQVIFTKDSIISSKDITKLFIEI